MSLALLNHLPFGTDSEASSEGSKLPLDYTIERELATVVSGQRPKSMGHIGFLGFPSGTTKPNSSPYSTRSKV